MYDFMFAISSSFLGISKPRLIKNNIDIFNMYLGSTVGDKIGLTFILTYLVLLSK